MALSNISISEGNTVNTEITPSATPLAITNPISLPMVSSIAAMAKNPAIVVRELPAMEEAVLAMAFPIASSLLSELLHSSSYL